MSPGSATLPRRNRLRRRWCRRWPAPRSCVWRAAWLGLAASLHRDQRGLHALGVTGQGDGRLLALAGAVELTMAGHADVAGLAHGGLVFGRLEGADSVIDGKGGMEETRAARNQHFRSSLVEVFVAAEFYPTVFFEQDPSDVTHKFRPYAMVGVGAFRFNPKGQYVDPNGNKTWVELKPLRTEGQGMANHPDRPEYNLTQINIPYGIGLKYFFSDKFNLSFEIVSRKTFTDYIDDVSTTYIADQDFYDYFGAGSATADIARQMANKSAFANGGNYRPSYGPGNKRGTPTNNDAFYSTTLKFGIRFGGDGNRSFLKSTRCPVIRF